MKSKETKQIEAKRRQTEFGELTPQQRLDELDANFGKGQGAARERARIARELNASSLKNDVVVIEQAVVKMAKAVAKKSKKKFNKTNKEK